MLQLTTQLGDFTLQGVNLLLQLGLHPQTGVESALQQGDPVFQAARRDYGTVIAAKDNATARITAQVADWSRGMSSDCK
ncbi:hypothetical protein VAWG006_05790 [Aeromonas enteropelogenes]|nr:hypothetical protein VAWG006_05790 [Aeromonas enteropelogenes]BEE20487.1 hypothetical protein VAWG007_05820 [Aeromonas enteropelogenes]